MSDLGIEWYTHMSDQVHAERERIGHAIFDGFADLVDPWFGAHLDEVRERFNAFATSDVHDDLRNSEEGYGTWPRHVGAYHQNLVRFHEALMYFLGGWRAARKAHCQNDGEDNG